MTGLKTTGLKTTGMKTTGMKTTGLKTTKMGWCASDALVDGAAPAAAVNRAHSPANVSHAL